MTRPPDPGAPGPRAPAGFPARPSWAQRSPPQDPETLAFLSGTALAGLDAVLRRDNVPLALWRDRLALDAAVACLGITGRLEGAGALCDAVHLLRPGELPGPGGAVLAQWRRAVARPVTAERLARLGPDPLAPHVPGWWRMARGGAPVAAAAAVLEEALAVTPRDPAAALILAEAVLARALGWSFCVPLLAGGLSRRDLQRTGADLRLACHRALGAAAQEAVSLAADLTPRAAQLRAVVPGLRAKGAGAAIDLFLTRDALAPTLALGGVMRERAARRLCDRLVTLGVVRELTGRASFRLYGL